MAIFGRAAAGLKPIGPAASSDLRSSKPDPTPDPAPLMVK